jgi:hypothetical protein
LVNKKTYIFNNLTNTKEADRRFNICQLFHFSVDFTPSYGIIFVLLFDILSSVTILSLLTVKANSVQTVRLK